MARMPKQRTFGFKKPKKRGRPKLENGRVPHVRRASLRERHPVHVNWKVLPEIWSLQSRKAFRVILAAFQAASERNGVRPTHYSVQANHVHLVVEAENERTLSQGLKGIAIRLAKGINRLMNRSGPVFADRFHASVLTGPNMVARALRYVLGNSLVHALRLGLPVDEDMPDLFCGGPLHEVGWRQFLGEGPPPVAPPRTWLLTVGWRRATC